MLKGALLLATIFGAGNTERRILQAIDSRYQIVPSDPYYINPSSEIYNRPSLNTYDPYIGAYTNYPSQVVPSSSQQYSN